MNLDKIDAELANKLNRETARISWSELASFYAQGAVVEVAAELDLIDVARAMAEDNTAKIADLMQRGQFGRVDEQRAQCWQSRDQQLWAVVIAPWVLVQDRQV